MACPGQSMCGQAPHGVGHKLCWAQRALSPGGTGSLCCCRPVGLLWRVKGNRSCVRWQWSGGGQVSAPCSRNGKALLRRGAEVAAFEWEIQSHLWGSGEHSGGARGCCCGGDLSLCQVLLPLQGLEAALSVPSITDGALRHLTSCG